MNDQVAIVGVGWAGYSPLTPELSYKELMYQAAVKAYDDAGINPRTDIDTFVTAAEDFYEGTSIFDEYVPDQLGAKQRPVHTIAGEGLQALAAAYMQILTGRFATAVVECHSKASNILTLPQIQAYAMDPILNRPLGVHPVFIAGLEMQRYLHATGTTHEQCAEVVVKNKDNALQNPSAAYGASIGVDDVLSSSPVSEPLTRLETAEHADGAIVLVLANADRAKAVSPLPIWIRGMGWANGTFALESRDWATAGYAAKAAEIAYRQAEIDDPRDAIDFAEVDDAFAYKEFQHLEAVGLFEPGQAGPATADGLTSPDGELPVNVSGGTLGEGHLLDASGLARVVEVVQQLREEAGPRQLPDVSTGLVVGWRGVPTTSGVVAVLGV
ncbi:MAG: acetyl-CoA acetyltransferase [Anaerolineae bacterium]